MFAPRISRLALGLMATSGLLSVALPAAAYTEPIFGEVHVHAYGGDLNTPGTGASDSDSGPSVVTAEAGSKWWCDVPGCSISFGPGAGLGWGTVTANPATSLIQTRAGALSMANSIAQWTVPIPGGGSILITPPYWGEALTTSYVRSAWQIVSTDPSVEVGDLVTVTASLDLEGTLEVGDKTYVKTALMLNSDAKANSSWLLGNESVSMGTVEDMIGMNADFAYRYFTTAVPGSILHTDTLPQTFAVGDLIVMETLLVAFAGVPNVGSPKEVWARFDQTLQSSLVANTPGVMLVPVPEPATWAMLLAGLGSIGFASRLRRPVSR
jgi:hypothetical protein